MKKYFNLILFFSAITICQAQSPVYDISVAKNHIANTYYKDINGVLDGYDGTYLYTNGNTSFKLVLKKKVLSKGYYYKDLIVGEFQFIENGKEIGNSLANINVNYTDEESNHSIKGYMILTGTGLGCTDCTPTEKRLRLSFLDYQSKNMGGLDIRKTTVNGKVALKVKVFGSGLIEMKEGDPAPKSASMRTGNYLMIKQ
jgi:hypothetical protein